MQRSIPSCVHILFKTMFIVIFPYIHTYIHACIHAHVLIDCTFSKDIVCIIYIHTCVHRVLFWFILMPSRKHFQAAEVLGVWFPKEYLAAKHIFHSKLCSLPYIHTYMHAYTHTFIDSLILFKDIYFDIQYSGVYKCYTSRGSKCLVPQGIRPHKSCSEASQVVHIVHSRLCSHPYIQACIHTHLLIVLIFFTFSQTFILI